MSANSPWIIDTTTARFEADVIQASSERPIIVDFWAPWCQPCRQLGPVLEKLANEYNGRFTLAKVNVDENQDVAAAFGVQSIPYVAAVRDGRLAAEFVGVYPEEKLREWLAPLLPSKAEELLKKVAHSNRPMPKPRSPPIARPLRSSRSWTPPASRWPVCC